MAALFLLVLGTATGALSAADLDSLVARSPFGSAPSAAAVAKPNETDTLEFRGLVVDEQGTSYSLFDSNTKRSHWIKEGGKGLIRVKNYDAEEGLLVVEQDGRTLTLPLKGASIAASTPVSVVIDAHQRVRRESLRRVAVLSAATENERRVDRTAVEVRRRRALRLAAPENTGKIPQPTAAVAPTF